MNQRTFLQTFVRNKLGMIGLFGVLLILLVGIVGPMFVAYPSGYAADTAHTYQAPSAEHWLGTDNLGLDVFAEIVWGARTSVYVSMVAVLCSACKMCIRDRPWMSPFRPRFWI